MIADTQQRVLARHWPVTHTVELIVCGCAERFEGPNCIWVWAAHVAALAAEKEE